MPLCRAVTFLITIVLAIRIVAQAPVTDFGVVTNVPERFSVRTVTTSRLQDPWEVLWGPDSALWVTERSANSIVRVNPATGAKTVLAAVPDAYRNDAQDGVLGLALHPGLMRNRGLDYVYVSFVYDADPGPGRTRRMKLRRYTYDAGTRVLQAPVDLLADLPSSDDHAGGRLAMSPDQKLFLTVGDLAANHLGHQCEPNRAQDLPTAADVTSHSWVTYQGKILRINLDGSIPADNPILAGVRSHVYSYGHRTPQGLAFGSNGNLYESEHGPSTDDELNLVRAGGNYGWPHVAGYQDDRAYVYANWSASSPTPCRSIGFDALAAPASVPQQRETAWRHPDFVPPLQTFFTVGSDYRIAERGNAVIAPSGVDVYTTAGAIPGWADSVLMTSLTRGTIFRVKLAADRVSTVGAPMAYFTTKNRYRDVAISSNGRTIFVATDNWGSEENPGAILAFSYEGLK